MSYGEHARSGGYSIKGGVGNGLDLGFTFRWQAGWQAGTYAETSEGRHESRGGGLEGGVDLTDMAPSCHCVLDCLGFESFLVPDYWLSRTIYRLREASEA